MLGTLRLRTLLIILVVVAVLPSAALLFYTHTENEQRELERTREDLNAIGLLAAANQEQLIEGVRQILATVSSGPSVRRSDLADLCQEFLSNVAAASPSYALMGVVGLDGAQRCSNTSEAPFEPPHLKYFLGQALEQRAFSVVGYVVVRESGRKALAFSMPVFDYNGEFVGAAFAALDLMQIDQQLKALDLRESVRVSVTDPAGVLLASSNEDRLRMGTTIENLPLKTVLLAGQKSTLDALDARGINMLHVLVPAGPAPQSHLLIRVSAERDAILAPARLQLWNQLAVLALATLVGMTLAWLFAQWYVVLPVSRLLKRMQAAGRGEACTVPSMSPMPVDFAQIDTGLTDMLNQLKHQQSQMAKAQEVTRVGFYEIDLVQNTVHLSPTINTILGLHSGIETISLDAYQAMIHPDDVDEVIRFRSKLTASAKSRRGSYRIVRTDGEVRYLDVYGTAEVAASGQLIRFSGAVQDVSEERRQRRLFQMQSQINEAIVRTRTRAELLQRVCEIAVEVGALPRVAVSEAEPGTGLIYPIASAGRDDGFEAEAYGAWTLHNNDGPLAVAMRTGVYTVCDDVRTDASLASLRDFALERGFYSSAVVPLMVNGSCVAALTFTAGQPHFFQHDEHQLLQAIGNNLSYALTAMEQEAAREAATEALRLTQAAVNSSSDGIVLCNAQAEGALLVYVNPAFERMTGYTSAEVLGKNCRFLQDGDTDQAGLDEIRAALCEHRVGEATLRNVRRDGSIFWNHLRVAPVHNAAGAVTHYVGVQTDVTERMGYEQDLAHRAHFDALTSLPNRHLLEDRLDQAIAQALRTQLQVGVAFLDLDNFKTFNDSIGHAAGDHVLCSVAERLVACLRPSDTVARLGGDEFVMVMGALTDACELENAMARIQLALAEPIVLGGKDYFAAASIGLAMYPRDGATVSELIQRADFAMYKAKEDGRGVVRAYEPSLDVRGGDRLELERALRQALTHRQFALHYQPKCDATTGDLCGLEALVRWNHPERGMVPPLQFISLAEQTGVIVQLGEWVLEEACRQNRRWQEQGVCNVPVAVNVSGIQFRQGNLLNTITSVLARTGLPPASLHIEITESVMMNDPEGFIRTLNALRALGVGVALDDFGTGYSSLSYLKRFPIDYVKIDRTFVRDITTDPMDAGICSAIISMAHNLGMKVIAEGVESSAQAQFLQERGCDQLQGYLIGRPQPADTVVFTQAA
ncbi:MAG: EAL domain-containing protein [Burkholderiaceae bacterium]|nr:EAL domain-containing protein [Burkholderiaceae bacterium]